jgi:CHAD domain-containing protein
VKLEGKAMSLDTARLNKSIRKIRKVLKKARRRPSPKEIHDFRTHTRRFETALRAFAMNFRRNEEQLLQDLLRLRKRAGKIRDMDVLTACASTAEVDGEQDCTLQLLEHLGAKRYRHAKRMQTSVRKYGPVLLRRLRRSRRRLRRLLLHGGRKSDRRPSAPVEAMATALQLSSELQAPARLNKGNLHSYRLKVKELRNVLEMSDTVDSQPFVDKLGEVKDAIGGWHDWDELVAIATQLLQHGRKCKLLRKLKEISRGKFEGARSLAYGMRHTYLRNHPKSLSRKKDQKSGLNLAIARPVLVATSAIAD